MKRFSISALLCAFVWSYSWGQIDHPQVGFVKQQLSEQQFADQEIYITDHYTSGGITHTYFKQSLGGIPIYNSPGALHYKRANDVIVKVGFYPAGKSVQISKGTSISAKDAIKTAARAQGRSIKGPLEVLTSEGTAENSQTISNSSISLRDIKVKLQYLYVSENDLRIVYQFMLEDVETAWMTDYFIDANSGEILLQQSLTLECSHSDTEHDHTSCKHGKSIHKSNRANYDAIAMMANTYEVYDWPVESPNFGDRTEVTEPWLLNAVASPNGWHSYNGQSFTTTRGNNTDAYLDDDNSNGPTGGDAARAEGGATLEFIFPLDVNGNPTDYQPAAITNTFYWSNLMHDVWYNYGFDEQSGNFQEENYTGNGNGSDYVFSEVQDGSGTCNANFGTPSDGSNPRMQMFLCNGRDGDFDNGVIAHEYGHGISNRLTGGPGASGCLSNQEQMGEGWSDYFGAVMTIETGDLGTDSRGIGTWLFGEGPDGDGIRPHPYSTDMTVNPSTYDDVKTFSVPHGVGSVWCTMLWDMTWALIDEYGFDADIYNGTGGNNIAMQLVMEGMKLQPCSPGFVDGRDAILEADQLLYGGANQSLIWTAFANRGLGYDADQGQSNSRSDGAEGFELPPFLNLTIEKSTATVEASEGDEITYQVKVKNNVPLETLTDILITDTIPAELEFVSADNGGLLNGDVVEWPLIDLVSGESVVYSVVLEVKAGLAYSTSDIFDDIESGTDLWDVNNSGSSSWIIQSDSVNSGANAWFANDGSTPGTATFDLDMSVGVGGSSTLTFSHNYDTEAAWDGGQVFISTDGGGKWDDLGDDMISGGYNSTVFNSIPGFSGKSDGFVTTVVDLSPYQGLNAKVRFQMNCDQSVGGQGWYIDDIILTDVSTNTVNEAVAENADRKGRVNANAVTLNPPASEFQATTVVTDITCNGGSDGAIMITPQGGSGSYTYLWSDGSTDQNRLDLGAGLFVVTISDGTDEVVKVNPIVEPEQATLDFDISEIDNPLGNNGSITVTASGGMAPYQFLWSNGETSQMISGLGEGIYTVTVTDGNTCITEESIELTRISCGDSAYDSGGSSGSYSSNESITTVICPDIPGGVATLTFNSFDVEADWDALYVHDGLTINDPLFASTNGQTNAGFPAGGYYGTSIPGPFTATNPDGCLTIRFLSDAFVNNDGWDASVTCEENCSTIVSTMADSGFGSLRSAVECVEVGGMITVSPDLDLETVMLQNAIIIDKDLTIEAGAGMLLYLLRDSDEPVFQIEPGVTATISNLGLVSTTANDTPALINFGTLNIGNLDVYTSENNSNPSNLIQNEGSMNVMSSLRVLEE